MSKDTAQHDHDPRRYWTQMLNMAEDDLGPFEYRLLAHYVRWASEGWKPEGYKLAAKRCKMSPQAFLKARDSLVALGYIRYNAPTAAQANKGIGGVIIVVDRWKENMERYAPKDKDVLSVPGNDPNQVPGNDVNQLEEPKKEELKDISAPNNGAGATPETIPSSHTDKPKRAPDAIFDLVAEKSFSVPRGTKPSAPGRIAKISNWLKGSAKIAGLTPLEQAATLEQVERFYQWYAGKYKVQPPKDAGKFAEHWCEYVRGDASQYRAERLFT